MKKTILLASILAVSSYTNAQEAKVMYPNQNSLPPVHDYSKAPSQADVLNDVKVSFSNSVTQDIIIEMDGATVKMDSVVVANYSTPVPKKEAAIQVNGVTVIDPEIENPVSFDSMVFKYKLSDNGDFNIGALIGSEYGKVELRVKFEDFNDSWALIEEYAPELSGNPDSPNAQVFGQKIMASTKIKELSLKLDNTKGLQMALEDKAKKQSITVAQAEQNMIDQINSAPQLSDKDKTTITNFIKEKDHLEIKIMANQAMPIPAIMMSMMMSQDPEMLKQYFTVTFE